MACGGATSTPSGGGKTYIIGMTTDLSGPFALYGKLMVAGFNTYIDYANKHGGAGGNQVKVDVKDDHADVQTALANYASFVQEGALGMQGPLASAADAAMPPVAAREGVLWIENSGAAVNFKGATQPKYEFVIQNLTTNSAAIEANFFQTLAKKQNLSAPKYALVGYQTTSEPLYGGGVSDVVDKQGWKLTDHLTVPSSNVDFAAMADRLASNKPDFVFAFLLAAQAPNFVKSIRARGVTAPVVFSDTGTGGEALTKQVADPNVYQFRALAQPTDSPVPAGIQTMEDRAKADGVDQTLYAQGDQFTSPYLIAQVVVNAIAKCSAAGKTCTPETYRLALENTIIKDQPSIVPEFGFTPQRHWAETEGQLVHYDPASGGSKAATAFVKP
jgi:ABC-type branched-subunit amino acid transport system substrate-binding protein